MGGGYQRAAASEAANGAPGITNQFFDQWGFGFNLTWELDLWGRLRRAIASAEDTLDASCANYNDVLVTLLGDVASNYVQIRTIEQRIELVRANVDLQDRILGIAEKYREAGRKNALDTHQARSNLAQTEAQVPQLRLNLRHACDRLCILLGTPPRDLELELGHAPIPSAPGVVVIGIPAELLSRRPDVRRAQHEAESQGEQIGIAEAEMYPMFAINGAIGNQATNVPDLWTSGALTGNIGPTFQWNILNYNRIRNNVRVQDARFQRLITVYQNTVLRANAEVEDGLAEFLRAQERAKFLDESVNSAQQAVEVVERDYQGGASDFNRVALIEQNLVQQQDLQAQSHGEIAQGLIHVYRALGGGWQTTGVSDATPVAPRPTDFQPAPVTAPLPPPSEMPVAPIPSDEKPNAAPTAPVPGALLPPSAPSSDALAPPTSQAAPPSDSPVAPYPPAVDPMVHSESPAVRYLPAAPLALPSDAPVAPLPPTAILPPRPDAPVAPLPPAAGSAARAIPLIAPAPRAVSSASRSNLPIAPNPPASRSTVRSDVPVAPNLPAARSAVKADAPVAPLPPAPRSAPAADATVAPYPPAFSQAGSVPVVAAR
jgi:NodT family efflux transporter outer membrane factor (OMF) lipoprotein